MRRNINLAKIVFLLVFISVFFIFPALIQASQPRSPVGLKWKTSVRGKTYSPIVARNVSVYIGTEEGILYVLRSRTGTLRWRYDTGEDVRCTPTVYAGYVFLSTEGGNLHVLDAFSGRLKWVFKSKVNRYFTFQADYSYISFPCFSDSRVYYSSTDGKVYALDVDTGTSYWSYSSGSRFSSSPYLHKGKIYFSSEEGKVYALNSITGDVIWRKKLEVAIDISPVVYKDTVFQATTDNTIYALRASDGSIRWQKRLPEKTIFLKTSSDLLYACSDNGNLYALDTARGYVRWQFDTEGSTVSLPTINRNTIYLGSNDGRFYSLDKRSGEVKWAYETGGFSTVSPVVAGDAVYGAASKRTTKGSSIEVIAFEKGSYPGKQILIGGKAVSPVFERVSAYLSGLAECTFSSEGAEANTLKIIQLSNWPIDVFLQFIKHSEEDKAAGLAADLLYLSPNLATTSFWYIMLVSPWMLVVVTQLVLIILLILTGWSKFSGLARGGVVSVVFGSNNWKQFNNQLLKLGKMITCLGEAFRISLVNYPLLVVNLATLGAILGVVSLFAFGLTSRFEASYLFIVVFSLWLLALLVGAVMRGVSLALVKIREDNFQSRFFYALQYLGRSYRGLLKIFLLYSFIFLLVFLSMGLAKAYNSFILWVLVVVVALASGFILFSDASIVLDSYSFKQAVLTSISLVFSNFLPILVYLFLTQVIFIVAVILSLYLLASLWGFMIFLVLCSASAVFLNFLHGLMYEAYKPKA